MDAWMSMDTESETSGRDRRLLFSYVSVRSKNSKLREAKKPGIVYLFAVTRKSSEKVTHTEVYITLQWEISGNSNHALIQSVSCRRE